MKIVTLQSVSGARLKIAAFGKITHSVTCIVALLSEKCRICPKLILKQVKVQATHTRTFTANGNSRPQKSGVNKGFSASDRFFSDGWLISKSHSKSVTEHPIIAVNTAVSGCDKTKNNR